MCYVQLKLYRCERGEEGGEEGERQSSFSPEWCQEVAQSWERLRRRKSDAGVRQDVVALNEVYLFRHGLYQMSQD